jgi:hypothetical protein
MQDHHIQYEKNYSVGRQCLPGFPCPESLPTKAAAMAAFFFSGAAIARIFLQAPGKPIVKAQAAHSAMLGPGVRPRKELYTTQRRQLSPASGLGVNRTVFVRHRLS